MEFTKTDRKIVGIPIYFNERVGDYVKDEDIPEAISMKLRGITVLKNENGGFMVPLVDIKDVLEFGTPLD